MKWLTSLGIGLFGMLLGGAIVYGWMTHRTATATHFDTGYQAVLFDTGLVYYGKIEGLGTPLPVLRDVYYIQSSTDPATKQVSNVLIRRGNEFHSPDHMVVNARHIVFVEPVGPQSKVAQLIGEQQKH